MFVVGSTTTYHVFNDSTYQNVLDKLDEVTATRIAASMNKEIEKLEVKHNAEISKLSQSVDVSTFTLPNS